jgi:hypothetical protein
MSMIRSRWAALGAAVAVTLGAGGVGLTQAALSSGEKPVYVSLDAPCRVVDTRSGSPIGAGDAAALTVQITGANGACTGALAIPGDAVGVSTNVTVIQPNGAASGRSYFTVYPTGATRPVTSNLNFVNGQAPTPNKVDVGIGTGGRITIYNNEGTAHAAVDIFGYYIDHNHDDRYYTEGEVDTALGAKADAADVYTKAQTDARLGRIAVSTVGGFMNLSDGETITTVSITVPDTKHIVYLTASASILTNSTQAVTCTSVTFCNIGIEIWNVDTGTRLTPLNGAVFRVRDDNDGQSLTIAVAVEAAPGTHTYRLQTEFNQVVAEVPFLNNASLTAMLFPLDGAGSVPLVASTESDAPEANAALG